MTCPLESINDPIQSEKEVLIAKFSSSRARPNVFHVVRTTGARRPTHEGGDGYERDAKAELFLLAVSNFVSETTFYESASDRDDRFEQLLAKVTAEDLTGCVE